MFQLLFLITIPILANCAAAATDASKSELRQLLAHSDPNLDVHDLMSKPQQHSWGKNIPFSNKLEDWKAAFTDLRAQIHVNVVLVGFQGLGKGELEVQEANLLKFLKSIRSDLPSVVLKPEIRDLLIRPKVSFSVKHATKPLTLKVEASLKQAAVVADLSKARTEDPHGPGQLIIPYHAIDDIVRVELHEREGAAFTVYLLNPGAVINEKYVYSYQEQGDTRRPDARLSCPSTLWCGADRYVWVDIAAGPTAYGPGMGHKGQVYEHTMVHASQFKDEHLPTAILPDMAAVVWSALRHHLWPPVQHLDMSTRDNIEIVIVQIHESLAPPPHSMKYDVLQKALHGAMTGVQSVTVTESWLPIAECDVCQAALSASIKELRSKEGQTLTIMTSKKNILDSLTLHEMLQDSVDEILADAGLRAEDPTAINTHIIPVFVFNMGRKPRGEMPLLLDGSNKATAFSDMVIAVSNDMENYPSHFTCGYKIMVPEARDVTREVLGALLTTGWGVPDTSIFFSHASGLGYNFLWSVGHTPFSPLSHATSLSSAQREAAHRNVALAALNQSVTKIQNVLDGFAKMSFNGKIDRTSIPKYQGQILQRLDLAWFKTEEAISMIGQWSSATAHVYLRSLAHDVKALEKLARHVDTHIKSSLSCEGVTNLWSFWWAPAGAVIAWPLAMLLRQCLIMPKLEKIY